MTAERKYYSHIFSPRTSDKKDGPRYLVQGGTLQDVPDEAIDLPEVVQEKFSQFLTKIGEEGSDGTILIPVLDLRNILVNEFHGSRYQIKRFYKSTYGVNDIQDVAVRRKYKKNSVFISVDDAQRVLSRIYLAGRVDFDQMQKVIDILTPAAEPMLEKKLTFEEAKGEAALELIKQVFVVVTPETDDAQESWATERSLTTIRLDKPVYLSSVAVDTVFLDTFLEAMHRKLKTRIFGEKRTTTTVVDVGLVRYADEKTAGLFVTLGEDASVKWGKVRTFFLFVQAVDKKLAELRVEVMPGGGEQGKTYKDADRALFWNALSDLARYVVEAASATSSTKMKYRVPVIGPDRFR